MHALSPRPVVPALVRLLFAASMALMLGLSLSLPSSVAAAPPERQVQGEFRTQILPASACPPPSSACARGVATGDIEGDTFVTISSSQLVFDATGTPFSAYTGTIVISSPRGDLSGTVTGRVRLTDGQLNSVVVFTSGTRSYRKITGTLQVSGQIDFATGREVDTYTGVLVKK